MANTKFRLKAELDMADAMRQVDAFAAKTKQAVGPLQTATQAAIAGGGIRPSQAGQYAQFLGNTPNFVNQSLVNLTNTFRQVLPSMTNPPPNIRAYNRNMIQQAMLGIFTSGFSPWIGARMMNNALPNMFGRAGAGGLQSNIFGSGGAGGFYIWYAVIQAINGLRQVMSELKNAIETGSKLYQQSAMTAKSPSGLFQLQQAFTGIGMSPDVANRLLLQAQFAMGKGRMVSGDQAYGNLLKAMAGTGQLAEMQQLVNMSREFKRFWNDSAFDATLIARTVGPMQEMYMASAAIRREWQTMWQMIATSFAEEILTLMEGLKLLIQGINLYLTQLRQLKDDFIGFLKIMAVLFDPTGSMFAKLMGLLSQFNLPEANRIGGPMTPGPISSWERMGLIVNGGIMGNDYARQTAENTRRIADAVAPSGNFGSYVPSGSNPGPYNLP